MPIIKINSVAEFDKEIASGGKVLVDFYADWCGPCKMIAPLLEAISNEQPDKKILKVNVDETQELMQRFQIMSIPTLIVFENGTELEKMIGLQPKQKIEELIK